MANTAPTQLLGFPTPGQDPGRLPLSDTTATVSTGANDAYKYVTTGPGGMVDASFIDGTQYGKPDVEIGTAFEALSAGDLVNTYPAGGVNMVRKAVANAYATRATGFVIAASIVGDTAVKVYKTGAQNTQVTSLTVGQQWLSDTQAGKAVNAPPTAAGSVQQKVGNASSATSLHVQLGPAFGL